MKNLNIYAAVLAAILVSTVSFAQSVDPQVALANARFACTPTDDSCGSDATVAQLPVHRPRMYPGPPRSYPSPAYPRIWRTDHSGRRALIGAAIGVAVGFVALSKSNVNVGSRLGFAAFGGAVGAGLAIDPPPMYAGNPYARPRWQNHQRRHYDGKDNTPQDNEVSSTVNPRPPLSNPRQSQPQML